MQMAVFLINTCKFSACGLTFPTLGELIQHIEESHIDSDPRLLEKQEIQQPTSLALSYVLRFFTEASRKDSGESLKKKIRLQSTSSSVRSSTPTGSEYDEDEVGTDDEDSDDSWTTQEEFSSDIILSMMNNKDGQDPDKPFACPVPGCKKRYKNVNGIKYHAKHGHRKDTRVKKAHKCQCGKSYKTPSGLRSHMITSHPSADLLLTNQGAQRAKLQLTAASLPQAALSSVTTLPPSQLSTTLGQQIVTPITVAGIVQNGMATITKTASTKTPLQQLQQHQIQQQLQQHLQQQQLQQQLQQLQQPVQLATTPVVTSSAERLQQQLQQQIQLQEQLSSPQPSATFLHTSQAALPLANQAAVPSSQSQKTQEQKDLNLQLQQHIHQQLQRQQQLQQAKQQKAAAVSSAAGPQTLQLTPISSLASQGQSQGHASSVASQVLNKAAGQTVVSMAAEQVVSQ